MICGILILAVGIAFVANSNGNGPFGPALCVVGAVLLIAGIGHAMNSARTAESIAVTESNIARDQSTLEEERDSEIVRLKERIRDAELGRQALGNLKPTDAIQSPHQSQVAFAAPSTTLEDQEVWDSLR